MNFLTYLTLRFAYSPVGEGILGGLGLIAIVILSPLLLLAGIVVWFGGVYNDWKEWKKEND